MTPYILAFFASYLFVGLKSAQQLHVVHQHYVMILPTSLLLAATEVYVIATVAQNGYGWIVLAIGLGAGLGSMTATYLLNKYVIKEKK
jgi:hypothetical protein